MKLVESTSPIIRTKTTDVTEADLPFVQNQLGLMWQVMLDNNGIGLAATQVGFGKISLYIIVTRTKQWKSLLIL